MLHETHSGSTRAQRRRRRITLQSMQILFDNKLGKKSRHFLANTTAPHMQHTKISTTTKHTQWATNSPTCKSTNMI